MLIRFLEFEPAAYQVVFNLPFLRMDKLICMLVINIVAAPFGMMDGYFFYSI